MIRWGRSTLVSAVVLMAVATSATLVVLRTGLHAVAPRGTTAAAPPAAPVARGSRETPTVIVAPPLRTAPVAPRRAVRVAAPAAARPTRRAASIARPPAVVKAPVVPAVVVRAPAVPETPPAAPAVPDVTAPVRQGAVPQLPVGASDVGALAPRVTVPVSTGVAELLPQLVVAGDEDPAEAPATGDDDGSGNGHEHARNASTASKHAQGEGEPAAGPRGNPRTHR
ncbi:MAG: hypothetical protein LC640_10605 [Frankia sp.]|nr:hypothetical protein [Frankia sp.]